MSLHKMTANELRVEARKRIRKAEIHREFGNRSDHHYHLNQAMALAEKARQKLMAQKGQKR